MCSICWEKLQQAYNYSKQLVKLNKTNKENISKCGYEHAKPALESDPAFLQTTKVALFLAISKPSERFLRMHERSVRYLVK